MVVMTHAGKYAGRWSHNRYRVRMWLPVGKDQWIMQEYRWRIVVPPLPPGSQRQVDSPAIMEFYVSDHVAWKLTRG